MSKDGSGRPECSFKEKCYRKNPHHFKEFKHIHLAKLSIKHPDYKVTSDNGIGLENLRQQLKIYADIEDSFQRIRQQENRDRAVEESRRRVETQNNALSPQENRDRAVKESQRRVEAQNSPVSPSTTNIPKKRQRSPSHEPVPKIQKTDDSSSSTGNAENSSCSSPEIGDKGSKPRSKIQQKLDAAAPYNFFLTKVKDNPATHDARHSIYMTDLMHPSLGKIKSSLQINFMVELDWLLMNYEVTHNDKQPLVILYGAENPELASSSLQANIRAVRVKPKYPFGTHHTKMMVFVYDDESVRVVVSTANLVASDWENRTQGLWVSPRCKKLDSDGSDGESPTKFKSSLLKYLKFYEVSAVKQFTDVISGVDMSQINVFFVASVPNSHKNGDIYRWGHQALRKILRQYVPEEAKKWPVKIQCSSIGSLGISPDGWMEGELGKSLSCHSGSTGALANSAEVELVYPSHSDVLNSYDGPLGGGCLPYSRQTHTKQPWLSGHMKNWRADASLRTRAMPHIKSYTRIDPDNKKMAYFHLTSANLSKAAWGSMNKAGNSCMIMSYEAGVLFVPKLITGEDYFEVSEFKDREAGSAKFPLHYDLPVKEFSDTDKPWLYDFLLS